MTTTVIKTKLTKFVKKTMGSKNPRFNLWYSGITNSQTRRKLEHSARYGLIEHWMCINAETIDKANEVEAFFSAKNTKNSPHKGGAIKGSKWVYIFKLPNKKPVGLSGPFTEKNLLSQIFGESK